MLIPLFFLVLFPMQVHAETFRITNLKLLSPHFFYDPLFFNCSDVTNEAPSLGRSVNEKIQRSLSKDEDRDLFTDFAVLMKLKGDHFDLSQTTCSVYEPIRCEEEATNYVKFSTEGNTSTCFDPKSLNEKLTPKASPVTGPCLETDEQNVEFDIVGSTISFTEARVFIKEREGAISGTLLGFLSEAAAEETEISGDPLSLFLRGSGQSCAGGDDRGVDANGAKGWWFIFEFQATPVEVFTNEGCGCESAPSSFSFFAFVVFLGLVLMRRNRRFV